MAIEKRNGQTYYYRKRRVNGRVTSEYVGYGIYAEMSANLDEAERIQKQNAHAAEMEARQQNERIDDAIENLFKGNGDLIETYFLINGYIKHKGEWRKKKNK